MAETTWLYDFENGTPGQPVTEALVSHGEVVATYVANVIYASSPALGSRSGVGPAAGATFGNIIVARVAPYTSPREYYDDNLDLLGGWYPTYEAFLAELLPMFGGSEAALLEYLNSGGGRQQPLTGASMRYHSLNLTSLSGYTTPIELVSSSGPRVGIRFGSAEPRFSWVYLPDGINGDIVVSDVPVPQGEWLTLELLRTGPTTIVGSAYGASGSLLASHTWTVLDKPYNSANFAPHATWPFSPNAYGYIDDISVSWGEPVIEGRIDNVRRLFAP